MSSWAPFDAENPTLAQIVRATFAVRKHATKATVGRDGSPRIGCTEVDCADGGEIYMGIMPGTMRAQDIRRDPHVAVNCPTDGPPADNPAGWLGNGKINATAVEVKLDRSRLEIGNVALAATTPGGNELTITKCRGTAAVRRR